jgi:hypothetical protein
MHNGILAETAGGGVKIVISLPKCCREGIFSTVLGQFKL